VVVERPWFDQSPNDDLLPYLSEPVPATHRDLRQWREELSKALQRTAAGPSLPTTAPTVPFGGYAPRMSPVFARLVPLRRKVLPDVLDAWWAANTRAGAVTVHRRLQLQLPEGDVAAGWRMRGRVRRLTTLHWVPVVVELWPIYDEFTMMTMTPQGHVFASKRYFRLGHSVLDRLWAELAEMTGRYLPSAN
jgi:hypothetical protein